MIILFILNLFVYTQIFKLKVENYVFQLTNDVCWRIAFLMLVSFRIFPNFASIFLVQNLPTPRAFPYWKTLPTRRCLWRDPHNNCLNRTDIEPVSATKLCYVIYFSLYICNTVFLLFPVLLPHLV